MRLCTYVSPTELNMADCGWPQYGRIEIPTGYVIPEGMILMTCIGIATGNGPLSCGERVEPRERDVSLAVVIDDSHLQLRDGTVIRSSDGGGGIYGPSYLVRNRQLIG